MGGGVQHKGDAKKVVFVFFFFCHKCFELGMDHEGWLDFLIQYIVRVFLPLDIFNGSVLISTLTAGCGLNESPVNYYSATAIHI